MFQALSEQLRKVSLCVASEAPVTDAVKDRNMRKAFFWSVQKKALSGIQLGTSARVQIHDQLFKTF